MGDKVAKLIRKQLRNVIQENIKEVLTSELVKGISGDLRTALDARMDNITEQVRTTLSVIDERSKDATAYAIRQTVQQNSAVPAPSEGQKAEAAEESANSGA